MALSVSTIINVAKISEYLSAIDVQKGALFGQRISPDTPKILYMERKAVEWLYDLDPSNSTLRLTANYLYSLCRGYNLQAQNILSGGSGGSVTPVTPSSAPLPYQFFVAASGTLMVDGQSSVSIPSFVGYNLLFARNGVPQSTITSEPTYYSWDKATGVFTVSPAAILTELFQLYAI